MMSSHDEPIVIDRNPKKPTKTPKPSKLGKRSPLFILFVVSFIVFNIFVFSRSFLINTAFDHFNVYERCAEDDAPTDSYGNCEFSKFTAADDIVNSILALSIIVVVVTASMLIIRRLEYLWNRYQNRSQPKTPPRRQPRSRQ